MRTTHEPKGNELWGFCCWDTLADPLKVLILTVQLLQYQYKVNTNNKPRIEISLRN